MSELRKPTVASGAGAFRMLFPTAQQLGPGPGTYILIASLFALGVALTLISLLRAAK